ncbi:MAG: hypothetical protein ABIG66_05470 [Candidatus Kerfeldbacteria bacterium]
MTNGINQPPQPGTTAGQTPPEMEDIFGDIDPAPDSPQMPVRPRPEPVQPQPKQSAQPVPPAGDVSTQFPLADLLPMGQEGPMLQPRESEGVAGPKREAERKVGRGSRMRLMIIVVAAIVVVVAGGVTYYVITRGDGSTQTPTNTDALNQIAPVIEETPVDTEQAQPEAAGPVMDSDGDGLLDSREAELGTDPQLVDTDNDLLTDKQEVEIYKTDPNNKDTDGDGYKDGEEVRNFFNPNGPGKLLEVKDVASEFNEQEKNNE